MNTHETHFSERPETRYHEPQPLVGWKLVLSWIGLFALGWSVALALAGGIYLMLQLL